MSASTLICIECPLGCSLHAMIKGETVSVSGQGCARGATYAATELKNPRRLLTTTVKTIFPDFPRLPVRTDREVPLHKLLDLMRIIDGLLVERRIGIGEVVLPNLPGTDASLVATDDMTTQLE